MSNATEFEMRRRERRRRERLRKKRIRAAIIFIVLIAIIIVVAVAVSMKKGNNEQQNTCLLYTSYCVFAIHTGFLSRPSSSSLAICFCAFGV